MKWHDYTLPKLPVTHYAKLLDDWNNSVRGTIGRLSPVVRSWGKQQWLEFQHACIGEWVVSRRPYYNLWPAIAEALAHTSLKISGKFLLEAWKGMPPSIVARWSEGGEPLVTNRKGQQVLAKSVLITFGGSPQEGSGALAIIVQTIDGEFLPGLIDLYHQGYEEKTLEEECARLSHKDYEILSFSIAAAIAIMAADKDSDILTPVLLQKDRDAYRLSKDDKYIERAKRKGLNQWDVGAHIECSPHMRRPHFGLRWTGKGGEVPKIVPIKGTIVRRNKMTEVPTGYLDDEERDATNPQEDSSGLQQAGEGVARQEGSSGS